MEFFDTPPLRYLGSKWQLADWITSLFPPHDVYIEPYCGSAAVFFRKQPSAVEVLNDLDGEIVNFFTTLRTRPEELIRAIQLTPYAYQEYLLSYEPHEDALERARRFYVRTRQSFGGYTKHKSGWRRQINLKRRTSITAQWKRLDGLDAAAVRLLDAQIECDDALKVIRRLDQPGALFYVDPPYPKQTRSKSGTSRYTHEMTNQEHVALAEALHSLKGMALISSYDSPLYRELYPDWRNLSKTTTTVGHSSATEYLWLSPRATELGLLPLFSGKEE